MTRYGRLVLRDFQTAKRVQGDNVRAIQIVVCQVFVVGCGMLSLTVENWAYVEGELRLKSQMKGRERD